MKDASVVNAPQFDSTALFRALDATRRERNVSWERLAAEAGVAASTLKRTRSGGRLMEADGVLAMIRLVGEPLKPGRLNTIALHAALDEQRCARGLRWTEVASQIGIGTGSTLQRLAKGGRTTIDLALACAWWLGRQVDDFVDSDFEHPRERERRASPRCRSCSGLT